MGPVHDDNLCVDIDFKRQQITMFGIVLSLLGIVLFESSYTTLSVSKNPSNRFNEIWPVNKKINWIGMLCWGCLLAAGSCVLGKVKCPSFILRDVWRV